MINRYPKELRKKYFQESLDSSYHFVLRMQDCMEISDINGFYEVLNAYFLENKPLVEFDFYIDFDDEELYIGMQHYAQLSAALLCQFTLFRKLNKKNKDKISTKISVLNDRLYSILNRVKTLSSFANDEKYKKEFNTFYIALSHQLETAMKINGEII